MITISLCMIVKNEERILRRCLDCVADLVDEIIIVDTGSTDRTKKIAAEYTEQIYDFAWTGNFSDARNFAFSKCTKQYIYTADADEVIDEENRKRFSDLKQALLPEIEIVQMKYGNQLQFSTIYNFDEEYRPKLYKRLREFVWEYPIHEAVRLEPVIYDSDIVITHLPETLHTGRDIATFEKMTADGEYLDKKLCGLYARELFISGSDEQLVRAKEYFKTVIEEEGRSQAEQMEAFCVVVRACRLAGDAAEFYKYAMRATASDEELPAEICYELGCFYQEKQDLAEAAMWFYNALHETESILNGKCGGELAEAGLAACRRDAELK
ncbi:MAG: glycosyltransferase family 2 protein [Lachnospiraceae bacterium]|nr:glycosyltransferase family 2 protein [Lachnospiraceae bacterium]